MQQAGAAGNLETLLVPGLLRVSALKNPCFGRRDFTTRCDYFVDKAKLQRFCRFDVLAFGQQP